MTDSKSSKPKVGNVVIGSNDLERFSLESDNSRYDYLPKENGLVSECFQVYSKDANGVYEIAPLKVYNFARVSDSQLKSFVEQYNFIRRAKTVTLGSLISLVSALKQKPYNGENSRLLLVVGYSGKDSHKEGRVGIKYSSHLKDGNPEDQYLQFLSEGDESPKPIPEKKQVPPEVLVKEKPKYDPTKPYKPLKATDKSSGDNSSGTAADKALRGMTHGPTHSVIKSAPPQKSQK